MHADVPKQPRSSTEANMEERRERKIMALLARNHQLATVALKIETLILQEPSVNGADDQIEELLREIPEYARDRFRDAIRVYRTMEARAHRLELEEHAYIQEMKRYGMEELTPQSWGERVFAQLTGGRALGKVTFERKEAYFFICCENDEDGKRLHTKWEKIGGLLSWSCDSEIWSKERNGSHRGYPWSLNRKSTQNFES